MGIKGNENVVFQPSPAVRRVPAIDLSDLRPTYCTTQLLVAWYAPYLELSGQGVLLSSLASFHLQAPGMIDVGGDF